jgi:hypothetical protein
LKAQKVKALKKTFKAEISVNIRDFYAMHVVRRMPKPFRINCDV